MIETIRNQATNYFQKDRKGTGYICPICGSGSGKNGTGIRTKDGVHYKCFACDFYGDIIDFIAKENGVENADFNTKLQTACNVLNIDFESKPVKQKKETEKNFTQYFKQCHDAVNKTDYWAKRGIGETTINKFNLGYDEKTSNVIIPINDKEFKARNTEEKEYYNSKGTLSLYNERAIKNNIIFICEGEIDALSIEELNRPAIALRGVSNASSFIELVRKQKEDKTLVLCLDNDSKGKEATNKIIQTLENDNRIKCLDFRYILKLCNVKDINDMLVYHRERLATLLRLNPEQFADEIKKAFYVSYQNEFSTSKYIEQFIKRAGERKKEPHISTGFKELDRQIGGGLLPGLYVLGACSSIGKSAFALQIADNIARQGTPVLYFALEMSKDDFIARSISREHYNDCEIKVTSLDVLLGDTEATAETISKYKNTIANNLFFFDREKTFTAIESAILTHMEFTGYKPVVFIDYLQLIKTGGNSSDKQRIDEVITALEEICTKKGITVFAISSFNRSSYLTDSDFTAFKESGGIEYTAGTVLALQMKKTDDCFYKGKLKRKKYDELFKKYPRYLQMCVLKSRYSGGIKTKIDYEYYPDINLFAEIGLTDMNTEVDYLISV